MKVKLVWTFGVSFGRVHLWVRVIDRAKSRPWGLWSLSRCFAL